ncbi:MAG: 4Fe-4S binding protein [Deltaproteobacteria bacterium]|nr:4Fe-4S binding protein [Deltaproteobacteria bacterium]
MRHLVQVLASVAQNAYLAFPWTRTLYQGPAKRFCSPVSNCHSCPAAVLSCPLGTLQHFLASVRPAVRWGTYRLGFSIVGFLLAVGLVGGRFACGWLCPFGLLQELLHKIPSPVWRIPKALRRLPFAALAGLVVLLPLILVNRLGYGEPWFCRLVCPPGTLEASGLFLVIPELRDQLGPSFAWKAGVLTLFLGWAVVSFRPYCQTLCPLGALYGLFNRGSLLRVEHDPARCRDCGACGQGCRVGLDPRRDSGSPSCLRCFECATRHCPNGALAVRLGPHTFTAPCAPPSTRAS